MNLEADLGGIHQGLEAHVLGNGESRRNFVHPGLGCVVIGCNAAYRDMVCLDYVAALDFKIIGEVLKSGWPGRLLSHETQVREMCRRLKREMPPSWVTMRTPPSLPTTGFYAIFCACVMGCSPIHLWGFDGGKANNIYAGTDNYSPHGNTLDWRVVLNQFTRVTDRFPDQEFVVHGESYLAPYHRAARQAQG